MVGLFAPSTSTLQRIESALSSWIMPPERRGDEHVALQCHQLLRVEPLGAGQLHERPPSARCWTSAWASMPASEWMAPLASDTPTIRAPWSWRIRAAQEPTLPKPWTTNVHSAGSMPSAGAASWNANTTPRPVAASRPYEPWSAIGLPVTIAGVWPWSLPYSSMNQAMVCALVPTSGAGMSRWGPSTFSILSMNERATCCSSPAVSSLRCHVDPALRAAERDADDGGLPAHQLGERAHLVQVHLGVEADAALVGPARAVVLHAEAGEAVDPPVG